MARTTKAPTLPAFRYLLTTQFGGSYQSKDLAIIQAEFAATTLRLKGGHVKVTDRWTGAIIADSARVEVA